MDTCVVVCAYKDYICVHMYISYMLVIRFWAPLGRNFYIYVYRVLLEF